MSDSPKITVVVDSSSEDEDRSPRRSHVIIEETDFMITPPRKPSDTSIKTPPSRSSIPEEDRRNSILADARRRSSVTKGDARRRSSVTKEDARRRSSVTKEGVRKSSIGNSQRSSIPRNEPRRFSNTSTRRASSKADDDISIRKVSMANAVMNSVIAEEEPQTRSKKASIPESPRRYSIADNLQQLSLSGPRRRFSLPRYSVIDAGGSRRMSYPPKPGLSAGLPKISTAQSDQLQTPEKRIASARRRSSLPTAKNLGQLCQLFVGTDDKRPSRMQTIGLIKQQLHLWRSNHGLGQLKPAEPFEPDRENTYRLDPHPDRRFSVFKCEREIKESMKFYFNPQTGYHPETCARTVMLLSQDVKDRIRNLGFDRYKIAVFVSIVPMEDQGAMVASHALWDPSRDGFATHTFRNKSLACTVTVYCVYHE